VDSPENVGEALFSRVDVFRGEIPAADDETILVLRRNAIN
jgi:hypothetical protein